MKKYIVLMTIAFVLLLSCSKSDSPDPNPPAATSMEVGPNTIIIDNATSQMVQAIDSTHIVFEGNTEQLQKLVAGKIIVSGVTTNASTGYLRRIVSVQKVGNIFTFLTSEATLTEAFQSLHIDFTTPALTFTIAPSPDLVLWDVDGDITTKEDQLKVMVNSGLTPKFHIKIDITNFKLNYAKLEGNFEGALTTTIKAGGKIGSVSKKITIYAQPIGVFSIPSTPIVIVADFNVYLGASGSINVAIEASDVKTNTINTYIEYNNNIWNTGSIKTMENQFTFSGLVGSASAKFFVKPSIDFKLWGSNWAKGSIIAEGYLKASAQFLPTLDCEFKAGIAAGAEANLKFFGWEYAPAIYPDIFDFSKVLYSCSAVNALLPALSTTSVSNISTLSATSGGNVTSIGNSPVTARGICWSTTSNPLAAGNHTIDGSGTGIFSSAIIGLTQNTTYYVRAYATNLQGTAYGNEVSFITQSIASTLPAVTTTAISGITSTTATSGGNVSSIGNSTVTARGICWSTSSNPVATGSHTTDGSGTGSYTSAITGLTQNTAYSVRAYATNSQGTSYGDEITFITTTTATLSTVTIGTQTWTTKNLDVATYTDGTPIPQVTDPSQWTALKTGAWCYYNNDAVKGATYGKLYNWYAVAGIHDTDPARRTKN